MKQMIPLLAVVLAMPSMIASRDLGFIIDVSGSMGAEIRYVKDYVIRLMDERGFDVEYYIIATFNDPYVRHRIKSKDKDEVKNFVNALTASGGDDCPEYAMAGTLEAISSASDNSILFLFTDAPAKDATRLPEVIIQSIKKGIFIFTGLTTSCIRSKSELVPYDSLSILTKAKHWEFKIRAHLQTLLQLILQVAKIGKLRLLEHLPADFDEVITAVAKGELPVAMKNANNGAPVLVCAKFFTLTAVLAAFLARTWYSY